MFVNNFLFTVNYFCVSLNKETWKYWKQPGIYWNFRSSKNKVTPYNEDEKQYKCVPHYLIFLVLGVPDKATT